MRELDLVIDELRATLARCDEVGVAAVASIHIDMALQAALKERDALNLLENS